MQVNRRFWEDRCDGLESVRYGIFGGHGRFDGRVDRVTTIYEPELFHETNFWKNNVIKLTVMLIVSLCGGLLCRSFCPSIRGLHLHPKRLGSGELHEKVSTLCGIRNSSSHSYRCTWKCSSASGLGVISSR